MNEFLKRNRHEVIIVSVFLAIILLIGLTYLATKYYIVAFLSVLFLSLMGFIVLLTVVNRFLISPIRQIIRNEKEWSKEKGWGKEKKLVRQNDWFEEEKE